VVHLLINFLGDDNAASALDVVLFVREIVEEYPALRDGILTKLIENLAEVRAASVFRIALWILGEYAEDAALLDLSLLTVRELLGALSFKTEEKKEESAEEVSALGTKRKPTSGPVVLSDGTYAMASAHAAVVEEKKRPEPSSAVPNANSNLRSLIIGGEFFLAACVCNSMTKLSLKFAKLNGWNTRETHEELAKTQLLCVSLLRLGETNAEKLMDPDSRARILMCLRVLQEPSKFMELFMGKSRETFVALLQENRKKQLAAQKDTKVQVLSQADELLSIRLLKKGDGMDDFDGDDVQQAMGLKANNLAKINRIYQLTGCADPVYVEAQLSVLDYDICLAILVVNQTDQTLQNVTVELNTSGDLKLVERPIPFTLKANGSHKLGANIKVTSTESGVIFGSVVYSTANGVNQTVVVLSNIYMDIMDYIGPSATPDQNFRSMWAEFEWENKVMVNTDINNLTDYLTHLEKITNMKCMTPPNTMSGNCQFLAANLYARSIFGEEALLNLSVEMQKTGKIMGYIRIRSKTQGIALALGDKINAKQRAATKS
jgi:coatomer subunit beta